MRPRWNENAAVEGIPLKLMIIAIILGITLPMIFIGLKGADHTSTENNLRTQITSIKFTARDLYNMDPGSSEVMVVDFKNGLMTNIDYVMIGDNLTGRYVSTIKYNISGDTEKVTTIENPEVPMTSADGETLVLYSGRYELVFTCMKSEDIDINRDGIYNDLYIQIKVK